MSSVPSDTSSGRHLYAERAIQAHAAMRTRFFDPRRRRYVPRERPHLPGTAEHLWPVARALVATLDLAGSRTALTLGFDAPAAIGADLEALERYWEAPAYRSDPRGAWFGGDRYYDDNAWVGLALVELERLRSASGWLERAQELFRFAVDGWDERSGGVFWVEQGRGLGRRNHDRNTVSNAPNAELGLHLAELAQPRPEERTWLISHAARMYEWVCGALCDRGSSGPASTSDDAGQPGAGTDVDPPGAGDDADPLGAGTDVDPPGARNPSGQPCVGLFHDKIRGDGSLDRTLWSYNQGSMIGAAVLLARMGGPEAGSLTARAEQTARLALDHYGGGYLRQPPAFNAIFFRNLLLLHRASNDEGLRERILTELRAYAEDLWRTQQEGLLRLPPRRTALLDQSALVQLLALLAWEPADYGRLA